MARKTRREKMLSDTRNLYKFQSVASPSPITQTKTLRAETKDLQKTFSLTLIILALQIVLFLGLKNHLLRFPGISY